MTQHDPFPNQSTPPHRSRRAVPHTGNRDPGTPIYDDTVRNFLQATAPSTPSSSTRSSSAAPSPTAHRADRSGSSAAGRAADQPAVEAGGGRPDALTPDADDALAYRANLIDSTRDARGTAEEAADRQLLFHLVDQLTHADATHHTPLVWEGLDDWTIVRLSHALHDPDTRDAYLARTFDSPRHCAPLMAFLTRALPAPERAVPATLLALHAFLGEADDYARDAIAIAVEADPDNDRARQLRSMLALDIVPDIRRRLYDAIRTAIELAIPANDPASDTPDSPDTNAGDIPATGGQAEPPDVLGSMNGP